MRLVESHVSPDALLTLAVYLDGDDWIIGFKESFWHTHGDLLTLEYGGAPAQAVRAFVDDVIHSRRVIVISRLDGTMNGAWVTDDPLNDELKYAPPGTTIEKRSWNGQPFAAPPG